MERDRWQERRRNTPARGSRARREARGVALKELRPRHERGLRLNGLRAYLRRVQRQRDAIAHQGRAIYEDVAHATRAAAEEDARRGIAAWCRQPRRIDHDHIR